MTTVKPAHQLTFRDRISQLTFERACKLLGPEGRRLIQRGGQIEVDLARQVKLVGDVLRVKFSESQAEVPTVATLTMAADARDRLHWNCTTCESACEHVGAMFSVLLENKTTLGLAVPPPERAPAIHLTDEQLVEKALDERRERARAERMKIVPAHRETPWTDYHVTSLVSGKTYRVALRGLDVGQSYCTCPDYRTNTLGTCKHIFKVIAWARKKCDPALLRKPYERKRTAVLLRYGAEVTLHVELPQRLPVAVAEALAPVKDKPISDVRKLMRVLRRLEELEHPFHIYPDAEEFIQQRFHEKRIHGVVEEIRAQPAHHPLRTELLNVPLLPYQLDGIAFAVGAGRAVLADDMGLGKTIQGVGVAELLAREANIGKVLVICPASLKSQWRNEIHRFCNRGVQLIGGRIAERATQYRNDCFFTVCNYEQVLRDLLAIEQVPWDLIILDEGQRIKNWEAKTTRVIKGLKSRFALVLSGTPLENRLDELYSVVQFIDDRRLGPGFRFFHQHRIEDESGKILGYKNLDQLRSRLKPILLRRTRDSVKLELPERTTEIVRIPPTAEQKTLHDGHLQIVASIVGKRFLTEMDLLRLRTALLMCRLAANGTFLVNKEEPNYSSKLERIAEILDDLEDESTRKVIVFSEWTTMLDLIEPLLRERRLGFVRLDGSVPQKRRQELVHQFQTDPDCRFFITTNAGSTGLNLQAANTIINVDLPWNPAILEQRIARAHRMGQKQPVQVFILVTELTLEENLLVTLADKKDLALAALDVDSDVNEVELHSGSEELKARLEQLLGARPQANLDKSQEAAVAAQIQAPQRERVAAAGGELLGAVFHFLGELVSTQAPTAAPPEATVTTVRSRLEQCVEVDEAGRPQLKFTLPNPESLEQLARTFAQLLVVGGQNS